jgi:hypothetical protein
MMRNVAGRTFDAVPVCMIVTGTIFFGYSFSSACILIFGWIAFRLWWFYRSAVSSGLFDD